MRNVSKPLAVAAVGVVAFATVKATESDTERDATPSQANATQVRRAEVREQPQTLQVGDEKVTVKKKTRALQVNTTDNERRGMRFYVEREGNRIEHVYPAPSIPVASAIASFRQALNTVPSQKTAAAPAVA